MYHYDNFISRFWLELMTFNDPKHILRSFIGARNEFPNTLKDLRFYIVVWSSGRRGLSRRVDLQPFRKGGRSCHNQSIIDSLFLLSKPLTQKDSPRKL